MKSLPIVNYLPVLTGIALIAGFYLTIQRDRKRAVWAAGLFAASWCATFIAGVLNMLLNFGMSAAMSAGSSGVAFPFRWLVFYSLSPLVISISAWFLFPSVPEERAMRVFRLLYYFVLPTVVALKFADSVLNRSTSYAIDTAPFFAALWWLRIRSAYPNDTWANPSREPAASGRGSP